MLLDKEITEAVIEGFISMAKDIFSKPIKHVIYWNVWRKRSMNSKFYKFRVLIGYTKSPTLELLKCFGDLDKESKFRAAMKILLSESKEES